MEEFRPEGVSLPSHLFMLWTRDFDAVRPEATTRISYLPSLPRDLSSESQDDTVAAINKYVTSSRDQEQSFKFKAILTSVIITFRSYIFKLAILHILQKLATVLTAPSLMTILSVGYFDEHCYLFSIYATVCVFLILLGFGILKQWCNFYANSLRIKIQSTLTNLAMRKSLALSGEQRLKYINDIKILLSGDIAEIPASLVSLVSPIGSLFELIIIMYVFSQLHSLLVAFVVFGLLICLVCLYYALQSLNELYIQLDQASEDKFHFLSETLHGIRCVKENAWERVLLKRMDLALEKEMNILRSVLRSRFLENLTESIAPILVVILVMTIYMYPKTAHEIYRAEVMFIVTHLIYELRSIILNMAKTEITFVNLIHKLKMLQKLLSAEEVHPLEVDGIPGPTNEAIRMEDAVFRSRVDSSEDFILKCDHLYIPQGALVGIVGDVGSGKTAFLSALLGELKKTNGIAQVSGQIAYVPQEPWIMDDTLKNNILFGENQSDPAYKDILQACALTSEVHNISTSDFDNFSGHLSDGQKQIVSLARAAYKGADILLFDYPITAVDVQVGHYIFQNLIDNTGLLKEKTRLVVTYSGSWLSKMDTILVVEKVDGIASVKPISLEEALERFSEIKEIPTEHSSGEDANIEILRPIINLRRSPQSRIFHETLMKLSGYIDKSIRAIARPIDFKSYYDVMGHTQAFILLVLRSIPEVLTALSWVTISNWLSEIRKAEETISKDVICHWDFFFCELRINSVVDFNVIEEVHMRFLRKYILITFLTISTSYLFKIYSSEFYVESSKKLIRLLTESVLRFPFKFFEGSSIPQIILRFGFDTNEIAYNLPLNLENLHHQLSSILCDAAVVFYVCPETLFFFPIVALFYYKVCQQSLRTSLSLQALATKRRTKLLNRSFEIINGATVIRAFGQRDACLNNLYSDLDKCSWADFAENSFFSWTALKLHIISSMYAGSCILLTILISQQRDDVMSSIVLVLTVLLRLTQKLPSIVEQLVEININALSLARINEYVTAPKELDSGSEELTDWPSEGKIEFSNVQIAYTFSKYALRDVSFVIQPREKIAIVGRTGAGKSSLIRCLFNLNNDVEGVIKIDDVNIEETNLHNLRSKIALVPRKPFLFSESVRYNLDPSESIPDDEIWLALRNSLMFDTVQSLPGKLNYKCLNDGAAFSMGQKWMLCIARALLVPCKILIIEIGQIPVSKLVEDHVQNLVRNNFSQITVLVMTSKISLALEYDRVLVMDKGTVSEFDKPEVLLNNSRSQFYSMLKKQHDEIEKSRHKLSINQVSDQSFEF